MTTGHLLLVVLIRVGCCERKRCRKRIKRFRLVERKGRVGLLCCVKALKGCG